MPGTRQYWVADTWQLYPMHCAIQTLSPAERTILEATDTLTALGGTVPTFTSASVAQMQAIQKLCYILLPILHQGTSNPITTDMPEPKVLHPQSPTTPEPRARVPMLVPSPRVMHASAHSIAPPTNKQPNLDAYHIA